MRGATGPINGRDVAGRISIRAPHAGSDCKGFKTAEYKLKFQSALPMRGATSQSLGNSLLSFDFNPRSPCGERPVPLVVPFSAPEFQSALPMRGATRQLDNRRARKRFQSALPMRGATTQTLKTLLNVFNFNPRSPCGERLQGARLDGVL